MPRALHALQKRLVGIIQMLLTSSIALSNLSGVSSLFIGFLLVTGFKVSGGIRDTTLLVRS